METDKRAVKVDVAAPSAKEERLWRQSRKRSIHTEPAKIVTFEDTSKESEGVASKESKGAASKESDGVASKEIVVEAYAYRVEEDSVGDLQTPNDGEVLSPIMLLTRLATELITEVEASGDDDATELMTKGDASGDELMTKGEVLDDICPATMGGPHDFEQDICSACGQTSKDYIEIEAANTEQVHPTTMKNTHMVEQGLCGACGAESVPVGITVDVAPTAQETSMKTWLRLEETAAMKVIV
jgi:hypothetical protein